MEYILVLLIVALLNGAIAYIDGLMEGIIPLTLYAEQYMSTLAGVDLFQSLFDIVFGFGVSLIVLKFLKKGFETYVLWSDGDADEEPIAILTNFFKAMAVAICFPTMYDWLATIVEEMSNKMLEAIGLATAYDWAGWVSGISSMGLVTAIFGLVFVIVYFILYFQFLMRGLEILILRVGIPLACVGLIDNDKGVFKPYMSKFFQSALSVVIQVSLAKLGVGLMMNMHIFWGVAWFAAQHFISDSGRAYRSNAVWSTQTGLFFHPAATCPVLLHWRRNCLLAGGCGRCNLNKWRYQLEQEYFQKPDDYRCGLYPAGRPGLLWHHAPFQCGFEGPDRSGTGESRGDSPWHLYHGGYG